MRTRAVESPMCVGSVRFGESVLDLLEVVEDLVCKFR